MRALLVTAATLLGYAALAVAVFAASIALSLRVVELGGSP